MGQKPAKARENSRAGHGSGTPEAHGRLDLDAIERKARRLQNMDPSPLALVEIKALIDEVRLLRALVSRQRAALKTLQLAMEADR